MELHWVPAVFFMFLVEIYSKMWMTAYASLVCLYVHVCVCARAWSGTVRASTSINAGYGVIVWTLNGQDVRLLCVEIDGFERECGKYVKPARLLSASQSTPLIYKPQKRWGFHRSRDLLCGNRQKTISATKSCDAGVCINTSGLLLQMKQKTNNKTAELGTAPSPCAGVVIFMVSLTDFWAVHFDFGPQRAQRVILASHSEDGRRF